MLTLTPEQVDEWLATLEIVAQVLDEQYDSTRTRLIPIMRTLKASQDERKGEVGP
jgi:hypothetical protein